MKNILILSGWLIIVLPCGFNSDAADNAPRAARCIILHSSDATPLEIMAAREVQRYVYVCTSQLLAIESRAKFSPGRASAVVVARKDSALVRSLAGNAMLPTALSNLPAQEYWLKSIPARNGNSLLLAGGDDVGTLYAAYRFVEHLGVRFYIHGDVIPDNPAAFALPVLDERAKPLFALRGIQPFHDFPEGPDWWNLDTYQAILGQLPKLRMNFFGLHTYPEGGPNAEPTVWIGQPADVEGNGRVKFSYASSYQNTLRGNWGYETKKTSDFTFGTSQLFEQDAFGAEVMFGLCPQPTKPADNDELFQRVGNLLNGAFRQARFLGIKTCVGTETPLTIPQAVRNHLQAQGKNPADPAVVQELYEGIFQRIMKTYPVDYYWFWTPEGWTWEGTKEAQVTATLNDLKLARQAAQKLNTPFQLATCGWVLGPPSDRALFDKALPKDIAVSCINREVGRTPVEPSFAQVKGRSKWAIPWMEDDPALTSLQLWAGRMRQDAVDALQYGCDGLLGIHWRTRVLGPAVSALAQAAWNQEPWQKPASQQSGWTGGAVAAFPNNPIAGTEEPGIYQTVRYNMSGLHLAVPNGTCKVILKFCEPHYDAPGKRVFGVKLQDKQILDRLDIFAKVGKNRALDYTYDQVEVKDGWLTLTFIPQVEFPSIAGIVAEAPGFSKKINCGGGAYRDYAADLPPASRYQPTGDFYRDWAQAHFGQPVAEAAARIFEKIDGNLPRPSDWIDGPGGLRPDPRPWEQANKDYGFVEAFAVLRPQVKGAGNLERFDYWLDTFQYMQSMGHLDCVWAEYDRAMEKVKAEKDPAAKKQMAHDLALPLRRQMVRSVAEVYRHLIATITTVGEMGTLANWEQHIQPRLLTRPGAELSQALGVPLPDDAQLPRTYQGPTRVIVPTVRTSLAAGEPFQLKVLILSREAPPTAVLYWRALGRGQFKSAALKSVARGVYSVTVPAKEIPGPSFEYYLKVVPAQGDPVLFPSTAPALNQTLVQFSLNNQ